MGSGSGVKIAAWEGSIGVGEAMSAVVSISLATELCIDMCVSDTVGVWRMSGVTVGEGGIGGVAGVAKRCGFCGARTGGRWGRGVVCVTCFGNKDTVSRGRGCVDDIV